LIWVEESIDRLHACFEEHQRVEHQEDYQMIDFDLFQTATNQRALWSPTGRAPAYWQAGVVPKRRP
jgi:hypothetical protein